MSEYCLACLVYHLSFPYLTRNLYRGTTATQNITTDFETGGPDVKNVLGPDDHLNEKQSRSSAEVEVANAVHVDALTYGDDDGRLPTDEERSTLRLVAGYVNF